MPPATSPAQVRERLMSLLEPLVTAAGYDLEDVSVSAAGRRSVVRVFVDADGGIDLDAVATVSRIVSDALDAQDTGGAHGARDADFGRGGVLAGAYVLEVSSPGVDRPLTDRRHWQRATGRLVSVEVAGHPLSGRVVRASGEGVTLQVDGVDRVVAWPDLGRGRVQVEFNRTEGE